MKPRHARPQGLDDDTGCSFGLAATGAGRRGARAVRWRRWAPALMLASATALLAACSGSLLPKLAQPPDRFTLDSVPAHLSAEPPAPLPALLATPAGRPALTVDEPRAAPGHDSRQMLYTRQPQQLEAFGFHEWVATPAQMLTPVLVRALQGQGAFGVVLSSPATAPGAWRLQTDGLQLQQDFTQKPSRVTLRLRAVLLNGRTRQAVAWREFEAQVPASHDGPEAGAVAAQAAAQQLASAVAAFCAEQVAAAVP